MSDVTVIVKQKGAEAATKEIKNIGDAAEKTHGPLSKMGGALGDIGKIAGGIMLSQGLLKLPGLVSGFVSGASDLNESLSKSQAVFGPFAKDFENFASSAATSLGTTKQKALEMGGTIGNLLTAMGLAVGPAEAMSKSILTLATDLGSFNNLGTEEVLEKLRAGLSGEAEPLKALGVAFSAASVEAKAAALGFKQVNGEFTEGQKIQARYALIMEQTKTAQGDFARTSGGLANQMKILKATLSDATTELGTALLPGIVAVANMITGFLPTVIDFGRELAGMAASVGADAWDRMLGAWAVLQPLLEKAAAYTWGALTDLAGVAWEAMRDAWKVIQPLLEKAAAYTWGALTDLASASWDAMSRGLTLAVDQLNKIPAGKIRDEVTDTENWAGAWAKVKDKLNPAVDVLKPLVERILKDLKTQFDDVKEALGPLFAAFGELGESLKPLQPLIEPLGKAIGAVLVAHIAAALAILDSFIFVIGTTLTLVIKGATLVIEGLALTIGALVTATENAAGWIGHWLNVAGGYFEDFKNMAMGPIDFLMGKIRDLIDLIGKIPSPGGILSGIGGAVGGLGRAVSPLSAGGGGGGGGGSILQYIGGGQMGYRPYTPNVIDPVLGEYQAHAPWQFNDPSAPNYWQDKAVTINLVVDGAVLASVVQDQMALGY